jgi:hypothetical protein
MITDDRGDGDGKCGRARRGDSKSEPAVAAAVAAAEAMAEVDVAVLAKFNVGGI